MHELGSILDDEVTIVTREVVEDNNSLKVSIIIPYVTQGTPSANVFIGYMVMVYNFNDFSSIFSS
jgi:hypothetical protein